MTRDEAIYLLRNTAWIAPSLEPIDEAVEMACEALRKIENSSEKPNNCEHITEDGVTCAKYPACDDCLNNPLNKVKGSERLVKGSEQTDCQTCKWWSSYGYCVHRECKGYEPQTDCGDFADRLAYERGVKHAWEVAQKVFDSTLTFYEAEDLAKQIDKDINVRSKDEPQTENLFTDKYGDVWEWRGDAWYCISGDEPQTETEIAKAIVHKMIDDAVIAEDAYPDLRQKMHDAVDEYEPLTDTDLKEVCREEDDEFTDRLIEEQLANKLLTDCAWK